MVKEARKLMADDEGEQQQKKEDQEGAAKIKMGRIGKKKKPSAAK